LTDYNYKYIAYLRKKYLSVLRVARHLLETGEKYKDLAVIRAGVILQIDVDSEHVAPLAECL